MSKERKLLERAVKFLRSLEWGGGFNEREVESLIEAIEQLPEEGPELDEYIDAVRDLANIGEEQPGDVVAASVRAINLLRRTP